MKSVSVVDLFCGVGGLTKGLIESGLHVDAGFDLDSECKYAYEHNNGATFVECDIAQTSSKDVEHHLHDSDYRVIVGCAPCQPFSNCTPRNKFGIKNVKWNLLYHFCRIVRDISPEIISMENVPQVVGTEPFNNFLQMLDNLGYTYTYEVVRCEDYNIPQKRRRLVLLASKLGTISIQPESKNSIQSVYDAIGDLPPIGDGEVDSEDPLHRSQKLSELNKQRIMHSVPGGTWKDWPDNLILDCHRKNKGKSYSSVYGRMKWNEPSPTITTEFYNYGSGRFGHPDQNRALSLREGALIQTFPKDYEFAPNNDIKSMSKTATHIGNAVPVLLGKAIGDSIQNNIINYG